MSRQQVFTAKVKAAMDAITLVCNHLWGLNITAWSKYIVFRDGVVVTAVVDHGGTTTFTWVGHFDGHAFVTESVTCNDLFHPDPFVWAKGVYEPNGMPFDVEVAFLPRKCWEGLAPLLPTIFGHPMLLEQSANTTTESWIQKTYEASVPLLSTDRLWDESKRYLQPVYRLVYNFRTEGYMSVYMDTDYQIRFVSLYQAPFTIDFRFANGELVGIPLLRGTAGFMR